MPEKGLRVASKIQKKRSRGGGTTSNGVLIKSMPSMQQVGHLTLICTVRHLGNCKRVVLRGDSMEAAVCRIQSS